MEVWKPVPGIGGYEVSNIGNVRSLKSGEPRLLKFDSTANGYLRATFFANGKHKHFMVARLVATAFIENPDNKPFVNHINGIKTDNRVENLEWCTAAENLQHAYATGLHVAPQGTEDPRSKLTAEQVLYIRENPDNLSQQKLGDMFGISQSVAGDVQLGRSYKNIGGKIREPIDRRVPDDVRAQIRAEYQPGVYGRGCRVLSKKLHVDQKTVVRIVRESV